MNVANFLVRYVLIFIKEDVNDQNYQLMCESAAETGLGAYLHKCTDVKHLSTTPQNYLQEGDEFQSHDTNEQCQPSFEEEIVTIASRKHVSTSSDNTSRKETTVVKVYIPLSKVLYQKIIQMKAEPCFSLNTKEIYEIIVSKLYSILDIRILLLNFILQELNSNEQSLKLMHEHHWRQIHEQLAEINEFETMEDCLIECRDSENAKDKIEEVLVHSLASGNDLSGRNMVEEIDKQWNKLFLRFVNEVRKVFSFKIRDSDNQHATVPSTINASEPAIIYSLDQFNMFYIVHHLKMSCYFLNANEQLLEQKFDIGDTEWKFSLEIDFEPSFVENTAMITDKVHDMLNKLLKCKFVCGNHVAKLILHIRDVDMELDTAEISDKECIFHLHSCGSKVLQSLPRRTVELHMKRMIIMQTVALNESIICIIGIDVFIEQNARIVIPRSCTNLVLQNVEGMVQCVNFRRFYCFICSRFSYDRDENGYLGFSMTRVICDSDLELKGNFMNLVLENVLVTQPHAMRFTGLLRNALFSGCVGAFNLDGMNCIEIFELTKLLQPNFNVVLPYHICVMHLVNAQVQRDLVIDNSLDSLYISKTTIADGSAFKLEKRCSYIKILCSKGKYILCDEMTLEPLNDPTKQQFRYKEVEDGLCDIMAISTQFFIENSECYVVKKVIMMDVMFTNTVLVTVDSRVDSFNLDRFKGIISLKGIVIGEFFGDSLSSLSISEAVYDTKRNVFAKGLVVKTPVEISCDLNELMLDNVRFDYPGSGFCIIKGCTNIFIRQYTGLLSVEFLFLIDARLEDAKLYYIEQKKTLIMKGKIKLDGYSLPQHVQYIELNTITVTKTNKFDLHDQLEEIRISECEGLFNLHNPFGICSLQLKQTSVVEFVSLYDMMKIVKLYDLTLEGTLVTTNHVKYLMLRGINAKDESFIRLNSTCQRLYVEKSTCKIHCDNGEKSMVLDVRDGERYFFDRNTPSELFLLKLIGGCLSREIVLLNNIRVVHLTETNGNSDHPIVINSACTDIYIQKCSGVIRCPYFENLDAIHVLEFTDSSLKIYLETTQDLDIRIDYTLDNGIVMSVHIHLTKPCCLLFSYSRGVMGELPENVANFQSVLVSYTSNDVLHHAESSFDLGDNSELDIFNVLNELHRNNEKKYPVYSCNRIKQIAIHLI